MIIQTANATGLVATPVPNYAGDVISAQFYFKGRVKMGDIIELGILPAFCSFTDIRMILNRSLPRCSIGMMSGQPGDRDSTRTCGNEIMTGASAELLEGFYSFNEMFAARAFLMEPVDRDRSIGISIELATTDTPELTFFISYTQHTHYPGTSHYDAQEK